MKLGLFGYDDVEVKAYDPNEPDPSKKLIGVYRNYKDAGNKLGCTASCVQHACAKKHRTYSSTLGKEIVFRLASKQPQQRNAA